MEEIKKGKRVVATLIPCKRNGVYRFFLQRRDKMAKQLPDWYGFFGGGLEAGETPEKALQREIKEELTWEARGHQFLGQYESPMAIHNAFFVVVDDTFEKQIKVQEGQYGKFFTLDEALAEPKLSDSDKMILKDLSVRLG